MKRLFLTLLLISIFTTTLCASASADISPTSFSLSSLSQTVYTETAARNKGNANPVFLFFNSGSSSLSYAKFSVFGCISTTDYGVNKTYQTNAVNVSKGNVSYISSTVYEDGYTYARIGALAPSSSTVGTYCSGWWNPYAY